MNVIQKRERAVRIYGEHLRWYEEHGASLQAYLVRYGSVEDPEHYGNGGEAIHAADKAALDRAEAEAAAAIKAARRWLENASRLQH